MKLVVAVDKDWGIGYKGELLARVRNDLKNFRKETEGKTVILGSKTIATFPGGRVLKNRVNIVLSRRDDYEKEGAIIAHSIDELFEILKQYNSDDICVIGGASIYNQLLPYCDTAIVTKFDKTFEKDTYIENLDLSNDWKLIDVSEDMYSNKETDTEENMRYNFCVYKKI